MRYRRADMAGGSYFFTVNLLDRQQGLLVEYVNVLREVMRNVKSAHPFHIDAMVILPDYLHRCGPCLLARAITRCAGC